MDAFRKQLDALMGANRNGDVEEVQRKYYEKEVCRPYLTGLCPHDLFQLTKMDLGQCPKVHSLQLRKDYEAAKEKGTDNYDREVEDILEKLVIECDRKIQRALKRLEDDEGAAACNIKVSEVTETPEAKAITKQVLEKLKEVDELEYANKMEDKFKALEEVEKLRQQRADLQAQYLLDAFNKDRLSGPPPSNVAPGALPGTQVVLNQPDAKTQALINEKLKKAEELGEEGRVDEAQKLMEEAEALKKTGSRPGTVLPLQGSNIHIGWGPGRWLRMVPESSLVLVHRLLALLVS